MKRLLKTKQAFTLVEVVISIALVGILCLMVGGAVTSTYKTATILQKIPSVYFSGQDKVENKINYLNEKLTRKYLIEKELDSGTVSEELSAELQQILGDLSAAEEGEVIETETLNDFFGKDNITVYKIKESVAKENGNITLYAGTAGGVRLERPVPVITSVQVDVDNHASAAEYFNVVGGTARANVVYSEINEQYQYETLYRWYVTSGRQRTVPYGDGMEGVPECQLGELIPIFPTDFDIITEGGDNYCLDITEEYKGKFLVCVATPLSKNGKMGQEVASNMIYISDLPAKDKNNKTITYRSVIDPSLMTLYHSSLANVDEHLYLSPLDCTSAVLSNPIYFSTTSDNTSKPYIDLNGDYIDGCLDTKNRFIHFVPGLTMYAPTNNSNKKDVVYAVVRKASDNEDGPFTFFHEHKTNGQMNRIDYGIDRDNYTSMIGPNAKNWYLVTIQVSNNNWKYEIGDGYVELAELVIVSDPNTEQKKLITDYFKTKYSIS